jgi:thiazole synthase ThiGH ThiG subunit
LSQPGDPASGPCILPVGSVPPGVEWPMHALPSIASTVPQDALEQLSGFAGHRGIRCAHVRIWTSSDHRFLDSEGMLECVRLLSSEGFSCVPAAVLDWSLCLRLSALGCPAIEVQVSLPGLEIGFHRPSLFQAMAQASHTPLWVSGDLGAADEKRALEVGAAAVLALPRNG